MPDKFVYIKTAETMQGKNAPYLKVSDQDGVIWNCFSNITPTPQIGKCYLFSFEKNGEWNNITGIKPLVNVFQQKALKEVANKNDIWRNYSVCFSYSKDLVIAGAVDLDHIFEYSDKIFTYLQSKVAEENDA